MWPPIRTAYDRVHQAAHLLGNAEDRPAAELRQAFDALVATMADEQADLGSLAPAVAHFRKVTASYGPHLFHCYTVPGLPRTTNDLEHFFGSARYHERRATGRKFASSGTVVRGAVRLVAAVATRQRPFAARHLRPADPVAWRTLRHDLDRRHQARRCQSRFRRDPAVYLAHLETTLLKLTLPP
jgi:hypothetical protein